MYDFERRWQNMGGSLDGSITVALQDVILCTEKWERFGSFLRDRNNYLIIDFGIKSIIKFRWSQRIYQVIRRLS